MFRQMALMRNDNISAKRESKYGGIIMTEMAAIYCRVSLKAGSGSESASILTQRAMLGQYCRENGLEVAGVYADDGWSGTNYQRPGFSRMQADVESGLIDTVVVKDAAGIIGLKNMSA